jgi:hypothetical protein
MKKDHILSEIKRTANENGGVPLGIDRFRKATGIRKEDWYGIFWTKWSDAQQDAGLEPNQFSLLLRQLNMSILLCSINNLGMFEIALYVGRSLQKSSHE